VSAGFSSDETLYVTYYSERVDTGLDLATRSGGGWSIVELVDVTYIEDYAHMRVGPDDLLHQVFLAEDGGRGTLYYGMWDGASFTHEVVYEDYVGLANHGVAVGRAGEVWVHEADDSGYIDRLWHQDGAWASTFTDAGYPVRARTLQVDAAGRPWGISSEGTHGTLSTHDGAAWVHLADPPYDAWDLEIAEDGTCLVAGSSYPYPTTTLHLMEWDGAAWTSEEIGDALGRSATALDLALGPDGAPHVALFTIDGYLEYFRRSEGVWLHDTVPGEGVFTSLAVSPLGEVQICFYDTGVEAVLCAEPPRR
jgi:hypothetical protein